MNKKKWAAWMGSFLILGLGFAFSADNPQQAARNSFQNTVKSGFQPGPFFVDENGDGICDSIPKKDGTGNQNGQGQSRSQRNDGSSFQNKNENNGSSDQLRNRFSHREENTWNRQSPRQNRASFASGVCDGTGPKGNVTRKGNAQK